MSSRTTSRLLAIVVALGLVLAACGGKKAGEEGGSASGASGTKAAKESAGIGKGETGLADAGKPKRGGTVTYGIDAESDGGWCLPEAQLSIAGTMIRLAVYDTLTELDKDNKAKPFLAESVEPDTTNQTFTITLRKGVKFHDGTDLTGAVVKNNFDAYLGRYPTRKPLLSPFIFQDVDEVTATGPLTVVVTTKRPWPTFPMYLANFGMMAQSQIDDTKTCDRKLVGTGPFVFDSWKRGSAVTLSRNTSYWRKAPDGGTLPYLDKVVFEPITETSTRVNSFKSGDLDMMMTSLPSAIKELSDYQQSGKANLLVSEDNAEVNFVQLNNAQAPFDDARMRRAVAMALDRGEINDISNDGIPTLADQPFYKGNIAYLDDPGFPKTDVEGAKALVEQLNADGAPTSFVMTVQNDPDVVRRSELIQNQLKAVGIAMRITPVEQAQLINLAISGKYQAETFRQFASTDPDTNYIWWKSDSPVNFARIKDATIDEMLDKGRVSTNEAARTTDYQALNKKMQANVNDIWLWYTPWAVAEQTNVHGIQHLPLPDGSEPNTGLATGHTMAGVWIDG